MAHGKETPRQKMIGMMYLVLTALLALNVAAEVLNAFSLIDNSLRKTTANTVVKNDKIYTDFEAAMKENPVKTEPFKKIADEVKKHSLELVTYIDTLKYKIVRITDGPNGNPNDLIKKDDINVPGQIMITEKENGKNRGAILEEKINEFREFLIKRISDTVRYSPLVNGLKKILNTEDIIGQEKNKIPWVEANFEHLPNAGVIALMSKMQADVRNAESDMLSYLYQQIDVGSFKFNKLEAVVSSPSSYVLVNQPYKAEVFIAACDTTAKPVIKLTGGGLLPVEGSKGIFTGSTGAPGVKSWGGVIEVKTPGSGELLTFPFKSEYTVGKAALVVSAKKMNVFYIGVENPVDVSVPGVPPDKVYPTISAGSITRKGGEWVVIVKVPGDVSISATADLDGKRTPMGSMKFRVKKLPTPIATIGNRRGGKIDRSTLRAQQGIIASLDPDFLFEATYRVTSFKMSADGRGTDAIIEPVTSSNKFTQRQQSIIDQVPSGKRVYFEDIKATGPDGEKDLGSIIFTIK